MPRDLPDWNVLSAQATVHEVTDLGELAVRLGSIVNFDRRGDVLWFDNMESGIKQWSYVGAGAGNDGHLTIRRARSGLYAYRFVTGSDSALLASISKRIPFPVLSAFGFECSFMTINSPAQVEIRFDINGISDGWYYRIKIDYTNQLIQVWDKNGTWQTVIDSAGISGLDTLFQTIKFVCDPREPSYARVFFNTLSALDIGHSPEVVGGGGIPNIFMQIRVTGHNGDNDEWIMDDVIVTQNEPV